MVEWTTLCSVQVFVYVEDREIETEKYKYTIVDKLGKS